MFTENGPNHWVEDSEYQWHDEHEDRVWYCEHGKAYGIRCKRCEESDD